MLLIDAHGLATARPLGRHIHADVTYTYGRDLKMLAACFFTLVSWIRCQWLTSLSWEAYEIQHFP
jgi:hypothetical protein